MKTPGNRPPPLAEAMLRRTIGGNDEDRSIIGDLREEYLRRATSDRNAARWWYWREAVSIFAFRSRDRFARKALPTQWEHWKQRKGDGTMRQLLADLRFGVRTLRCTPGYTTIAAITLALGIGANTAIFSVVDSVLLNPLPYPDSDEIVGVWHHAPGLGYDQFGISPGVYFQYLEQNDVFESIALFQGTQRNLTGDGDPERILGMRVSRSLFDVLRVPPAYGRVFLEEEDLPGASQTVVLSHSLWARRFGSDPALVGRSVQLNGESVEVVGIMPAGFSFPSDDTDFWLPLAMDPEQAPAGAFGWNSVARLTGGIPIERARAQVDQLALRLRETYADQTQFVAFLEASNFGSIVETLKNNMVSDLASSLWILLGTVGFVMLIACANVANLTLVRGEAQRRETAVRTALGADRWILTRQKLSESVVLACLGGVLGLGLAWVGIILLARIAPATIPRLDEIGIDATVLVFTSVVTVVSAILFGLASALKRVSPTILGSLIQSGTRSSAGRDRQFARSALVVVQTAMALVLLIGSGLMVRSFWEIKNVDPGFIAEDVLTFRLSLPPSEYPGQTDVANFHQRVLDRLADLPGVVGVGAVQDLPLGGSARGTSMEVEDRPTPEGGLPPIFWFTSATPGYFETMRIPLRTGRTFDRRDHETASAAVIISAAVADRLWQGESPIGKRIRFASGAEGWLTVVGVVGSVRSQGLDGELLEAVYAPMAGPEDANLSVPRSLVYTVRSANPTALIPSIRSAIWELNATLPIAGIELMERIVARSVAQLSFTMLALLVAAVMALLLGTVGLYGVLSYVVTQRTQEIGVRLALGARPGVVQKMVVFQGAKLAAFGVTIGLAGAAGLTRFMQSILFDTTALDPFAFGATSMLLLAVGLLASYIPARRASAVDPMKSLRMD
jgi:predicted permease